MKRIIFLLLAVFCISYVNAHATEVDKYASSNTVNFSTTPTVVTFNSVVNKLYVKNNSLLRDCHVTYAGLGWNSTYTTYINPTTVSATAATGSCIKLGPQEAMSIDFATNKIGFISTGNDDIQRGNVSVTYIVSTDNKQP